MGAPSAEEFGETVLTGYVQRAPIEGRTVVRDIIGRKLVEDRAYIVIGIVTKATIHVTPTTPNGEAVLALLSVFALLDGTFDNVLHKVTSNGGCRETSSCVLAVPATSNRRALFTFAHIATHRWITPSVVLIVKQLTAIGLISLDATLALWAEGTAFEQHTIDAGIHLIAPASPLAHIGARDEITARWTVSTPTFDALEAVAAGLVDRTIVAVVVEGAINRHICVGDRVRTFRAREEEP